MTLVIIIRIRALCKTNNFQQENLIFTLEPGHNYAIVLAKS